MSDKTPDPAQKKIMQLYAAFGAGLALSVVPSFTAATVSLILFLGITIAAYIMRSGAENGSLTENHMTYIIRTIWIGGLYALIAMVIGSAYMLYTVDNTPLEPCIEKLMNMAMSMQAEVPDVLAVQAIFEGCLDDYLHVNKVVFIISGVIVAGPVLLYFIMRFVRGLRRALGGYRVANHTSWL